MEHTTLLLSKTVIETRHINACLDYIHMFDACLMFTFFHFFKYFMLQRLGGTARRRQRQTWLARFSFLGSFQVQTCFAIIDEPSFMNMIKTRNLGTISRCVMTANSNANH